MARHHRYAAMLGALLGFCAQAQAADPRPNPSELAARVEAGKQEGGFCATVNWPRRTTIADFFGYLDSSEAGSIFLARSDYGNTGGCSYYRVVSVSRKGQQKCANTISWACFDKGDQSGQCIKGTRTWCSDGASGWRIQM